MANDNQQNAALEASATESAAAGNPRQKFRVIRSFGSAIWQTILPVLLALTFYILITPIGFFHRLFFRDPMARTFDSGDSYRVISRKATPSSMEKPS